MGGGKLTGGPTPVSGVVSGGLVHRRFTRDAWGALARGWTGLMRPRRRSQGPTLHRGSSRTTIFVYGAATANAAAADYLYAPPKAPPRLRGWPAGVSWRRSHGGGWKGWVGVGNKRGYGQMAAGAGGARMTSSSRGHYGSLGQGPQAGRPPRGSRAAVRFGSGT